MSKTYRTLKERIFSNFTEDHDTGCWLWRGAKDHNGYGVIGMRVPGAGRYAHRIAYQLAWGPIPPRLCVLHRCDTPQCINPLHLFLGTQAHNMQDMQRKGRGKICKAGEHTEAYYTTPIGYLRGKPVFHKR
jgi:HNH endonuclease